MVIKSKESKISKYSKLVDKYLNVVYELQNDIDDLEVNYIMELLDGKYLDCIGLSICIDGIFRGGI